MKQSEILKEQAQQEDGDFAYMNLMKKSFREARLEKFEEEKYPERLKAIGCIVLPFDEKKISIDTQNKYGIIDFFPKANKILIRNKNTWVTGGFAWINKNLLKYKH